ncbi:MAG TPA: 30S ribosomal protein S12 methylthiotransferase RimO, partial [Bacillota bacterium]|nr:30S ribosomal protein S12 methylthiotransferase RimO [Bacillota bacterium]
MDNKPIKVAFVSLGCPKNLIDTEVMISILNKNGFEIVADDFEADVIVINTCAFIEEAKKEAIENILDIAWLKENKDLKGIVVAGCLAERYREEILSELPEADALIGTGSIEDICNAVNSAYKGSKGLAKYCSFRDASESPLGGERVVTTPEHFAYLKIAEGCDNHCTYCIIPKLRGKFRSRQMNDIVEEARDLASLGAKEICLIAQDTTRYGTDLFGVSALDTLIHEISKIKRIEWIRTLYCYPERITDGLIDEIAKNPKALKYFDIPIQHISDHVLKLMNRAGDSASIRSVINRIRKRIPNAVLRTTVMVGFPGETEEDFNELLEFVKEGNFQRLGAFEYSREEGTPSFDFENQVDEKTKQRRRELIMQEQQKIHVAFNESLVGKTLKVICEGFDAVSETYYGRSEMDAYDVDGKIFFSSGMKIPEGKFVN